MIFFSMVLKYGVRGLIGPHVSTLV